MAFIDLFLFFFVSRSFIRHIHITFSSPTLDASVEYTSFLIGRLHEFLNLIAASTVHFVAVGKCHHQRQKKSVDKQTKKLIQQKNEINIFTGMDIPVLKSKRNAKTE